MRTGRSHLRVLMLASAMVLATTDVGLSQEQGALQGQGAPQGDDTSAASVSARAAAIAADIDGRVAKAENEDAKKCLREKKTAVNNLKAGASTSSDLAGLLSQINEVAGQLDSCTSGPNGSPGSSVQMKVDANTPDPNATNPSITIPPGPGAVGPGVIGGDVGPDFGGGGVGGTVGDVGFTAPVIPPPPVSPTL